MRKGRILLAALALAAAPAAADENQDLELIPEAAREPAAPASEPASPALDTTQRIYVENAVTALSLRALLVPFPPPAPPDWQELLFLDARKDWTLAPGLSLDYSGRLNFRAENDIAFPSHENVRHDFREGFLSWEPIDRLYLDLGRINLKSGVAAGFNPTDFFKTRAVVAPLSADPAVLREDRLGTLMVSGQRLWEGAAVTAAFAPKIENPTPLYNNLDLPSVRPMFDRTNAADRLLLKASADLAEDFSPEAVLYHEGDFTRVGANLTRSVGQATIVYLEWAGGRQTSLIDAAERYGRDVGTIPGNAPSALPESPHESFQSQLALGGSYTTESKIVFNLEYHYNEAGFSAQDWRNWFHIGSALSAIRPVTSELWFIRAYAQDQQEPVGRNSAFLRADWVDAFVPKLELVGFISTELHDGSSLVQLTADYYLSNQWTVGALAAAEIGTKRSTDGSLPQALSVLVKLARYF